jgi:hypothetical protein
MRFLFGSPVPQDRRETVAKHLSHILGSSGVVECLVQRADKSLVVLSRRADAPQRLTVTDARGVTKDVGSAEEYFELALLGWHEIETVADSATAKIQLVDRIKGGPQVRKLYAAIERNIELARDHLPLLQQRLKRLDEALRDLWELQRKRDTLTRLEKAELLDLQNRYEWFLRAEEKLVGYQRRLEANRGQLEGILPLELAVETEDGEDGQPPGPLKLILTQIASSLADLKSFDQTTLSSLQGTRDTLVASLKEAQSEVANAFAIFRGAQYNPKVESLPPDDRDVLTRQIQILEETRSLPQKEEESRNLHAEVVRLAATVEQVCDEVCKARDEICTIREDAIAELNAALDTVRLTFGRSGDRTRLTTYKQRYAHDSGQFLGFIQGFGQRESYENLRALFRSVKDTSLDSDAWKVNNLLWDVKFVELLDVVDNDDVEIALNVGKAGFVPIQNLSSGQRCTAVFPLLLRNSRGPLVIDQPEDNLDNRHIADTIAPDLLSRKQAQQFIVTSHNANLVVLTDADLIIHMDSDGSCGWIEKAGFLACPESRIRDRVLEVLDGGKAALEARRQKYGSPSAT